MRSFAKFERITDSDGMPIDGKAKFYKHNTSVAADTIDSSGANVPSVQTITEGWLENDVFIADENIYDVDVVVTNFNDEQILPVKVWPCPKFSVTTFGVNIPATPTITHLQSWQGMEDGDIVCTLGYYAENDRRPINYVYDADSTLTADGGHVISSNGAGKWISVDDGASSVDSMLYGIYGTDTNAHALEMPGLANWSALNTYANSIKKNIRFNVSNGTLFYIPAGTYKVEGVASLFSTNSQTVNITSDGNQSFYSNATYPCNWNVTAPSLKASNFYITSGAPTIHCDRFEMNSSAFSCSLANCSVNITRAVSAATITFTDCEISSVGNLYPSVSHPLTFVRCHITASMFGSSADFDYCTFTNCWGYVHEWVSKPLGWLKFNLSQGVQEIDCLGLNYDDALVIPRNIKLKNLTVATLVCADVPNSVKYNAELENVTASNVTCDTLRATNSIVTYGNFNSVIAKNSTINLSTYVGTSPINMYVDTCNVQLNDANWVAYIDARDTHFTSGRLHVKNGVICNCTTTHNIIVHPYVVNTYNYLGNLTISNTPARISLAAIIFADSTSTTVSNIVVDNLIVNGHKMLSFDVTKFNHTNQGFYKIEDKMLPETLKVKLTNVPMYQTGDVPAGLTTPYIQCSNVLGTGVWQCYVKNVKWCNYNTFKEENNNIYDTEDYIDTCVICAEVNDSYYNASANRRGEFLSVHSNTGILDSYSFNLSTGSDAFNFTTANVNAVIKR